MGEIIKNGFDFMERANAHLIRKIDDIPELKNKLITLSEAKTHIEMSEYALLLIDHILDVSGIEHSNEIEECITVIKRWQRKEATFQEARDVAGALNGLARDENDPVKIKAYRALGQAAVTPHVKWHALVASEYSVVVINLLYPGNLDRVKEEREFQIKLMQSVYRQTG